MQEVHQLCDLGLMLLKQISMRLTKGKPAEPGHFPAQVVLPKLIFRPNLQQREQGPGQHARATPSCSPAGCPSCIPSSKYSAARPHHRTITTRTPHPPHLPCSQAHGRQPPAPRPLLLSGPV